ncbi:MAG: hypothetical protein ABH986_04120 [archaeon]
MKGMVNLETIIVILIYFSVIGLFVNSLSGTNNLLKEKTNFISAKGNALKCSMLADSVYSNSGGNVSIEENCFYEEGKIKSIVKEETAEEKTLTEKIINSEKKLEIGVEDHYK